MRKNKKKIILPSFLLFMVSLNAFEIPLAVTNAQVGQLIIGCNANATDRYDRGIDILVPPIGMGTGTVGIEQQMDDSRKTQQDRLYKDIRTNKFPQVWNIACQVAKKPVAFAWNPDAFPDNITFAIRVNNGKTTDMRAVKRLVIRESATLTITAFQAENTPETPKH